MQDEEKRIPAGIRKGIKEYFRNLFDIRGDMMSYEEIDRMMEENTVIHGSNMWILMLAILIASIGLNVNSTAVIIGAMLISPLMSAILAMGYSLAVRDLSMLRKAFSRFGTQVAISLIASTIYFFISPLDEPTTEMIARINPTIWDVLIALFGGIAGIIGNTRQKKGNVIPGVAIATALMPPLCTVGYGLATLQAKFILGAFYLFLINTLFIALSSALVITLLGVPKHAIFDDKRQKKINRIIMTITIVTVIPSLIIGANTVYHSYMKQCVENYLRTEFVFSDTQLVQSNVDTTDKQIAVSLVGTPISQDTIAMLEKQLGNYNLGSYTLRVTQNSVLVGDTDGENTDKITIALQEKTIADLQQQVAEQQTQLDEMTNKLENSVAVETDYRAIAQKAETIFPKLSGCTCGKVSDAEGDAVLLIAKTEENMTDEELQIIENWLKSESGLDRVRLSLES